jgi:quercetin dioxygenase-like cupin family protein
MRSTCDASVVAHAVRGPRHVACVNFNAMNPPARFDLVAEVQQVRAGAHAAGHVAKTLVRTNELRLVLMVLQRGAELPVHQAEGAMTVHALDGRLRIVAAESHFYELVPGQLLVLEPGVPHSVTAIEDSAILLSIAWRGHHAPT